MSSPAAPLGYRLRRPVLARGARVQALALAAALIWGCAGSRAVTPNRFPFASGETVQVTGMVTDARGTPLRDLDVVLEASREGFGLEPLGGGTREVSRGATRTDRQGEFGLEWGWSRRYNRFELVVGVPVSTGAGERLHELERVDLTRRLRQGSPVAVPLVIEDTSFLATLRGFLASLSSPDEKRVYQEMGKPDRVDEVDFPDRREASWWYFDRGKVYRFVDGRLAEVDEFEPISPL
ncbi:MAG TPA: hypothetical protein VMT16_13025 [Thermoanaerobaculia bacterium]|nr:hypothetical protein [Thermoanaerobaculia bacterium]